MKESFNDGFNQIISAYQEIDCDLCEIHEAVAEGRDNEEINRLLDESETRMESLLNSDIIFLFEKRLAEESDMKLEELRDLKVVLIENWNNCRQTMEFFGLIAENRGVYLADYDGSREVGGEGKNLIGTLYQFPNFGQIFRRLRPEHLKGFLLMLKLGMEPQLQVTPIAYKMETLLSKLRGKKNQSVDNQKKPLVREVRKLTSFNENEHYYDLGEVLITAQKARGTNVSVSFGGSLSKSQWIEVNKGFLVEIVATKPYLLAGLKSASGTNAVEMLQLGLSEFKKKGFFPKSLESHLFMLMGQIKAGDTKNIDSLALLPGTNGGSPEFVKALYYTAMRDVGVAGYSVGAGRDSMWLPPAIAI